MEHIEDDGLQPVHWHRQRITMATLTVDATRGLTPTWAVEVSAPLRLVRSRIRYEDPAGQPFVPLDPGLHHRNETLTRIADLQAGMRWSRAFAGGAMLAGAGSSVPVGRTEHNPFELGHHGIQHQHTQFGTGTWAPYASLGWRRPFGVVQVQLDLRNQWSLATNTHGFRAGDRWSASASAARRIAAWSATLGAQLVQEGAETWGGVREMEGNLGRTDLWLRAGLGRMSPIGAVSANLAVPVASEAAGAQTESPIVVQLSLSR